MHLLHGDEFDNEWEHYYEQDLKHNHQVMMYFHEQETTLQNFHLKKAIFFVKCLSN